MNIFTLFVTPQTDFMPKSPQLLRTILWNIRNPFPGLSRYLGTRDEAYKTVGLTVSTRNPHGLTWRPLGGINQLVHTTASGRVLRFISYRGIHIEAYVGTKPDGSFGMALRVANSHGY